MCVHAEEVKRRGVYVDAYIDGEVPYTNLMRELAMITNSFVVRSSEKKKIQSMIPFNNVITHIQRKRVKEIRLQHNAKVMYLFTGWFSMHIVPLNYLKL